MYYIKKSDESLIDIQFFELVYLDNSGKYSDLNITDGQAHPIR